jgi:lactoylglutathione lyase
MKTLHTAYRVQDLDRSIDFYSAVGFLELGRVELPDGTTLLMLHLAGDGDVVTLELVYDPRVVALDIGNGFSHIAVQVDDLDSKLSELSQAGLSVPDPQLPAGAGGPKTCFLHDPDGYRMELVQWPPGHADGITSADFR